MSTLAIVLVAVAAVLLVLFVGGLIAAGRRQRALDDELHRRTAAANRALADAHATDKGWHRETIEQAAREEYRRRNPQAEVEALHLVQVIDNPGTDSDLAVFQVVADGRAETLTLGRTGADWVAV